MSRATVPGTVVLRWVENHEFRVSVPDTRDPLAMARAGEEAVARSGIFQRYGVILESVALGVIEPPEVRNGDTPTYP